MCVGANKEVFHSVLFRQLSWLDPASAFVHFSSHFGRMLRLPASMKKRGKLHPGSWTENTRHKVSAMVEIHTRFAQDAVHGEPAA